ncbi:MAG TPA: alpha/beta hydrolase [Stellaceae bacterium]|nr:alpha/beta hydrolase [Stellaceae bacterium]
MPYATAADGVRLYYETQGSGPPVVCVHELAGSCRSFDPQQAAWQARFQCIAFNARGYPPSDVPAAVPSYGQDIAAADIGAVLDALALDDAHVMGVSMGAAATLHFALRNPARVRSIVLCSIGSGSDLKPGEYAANMEAMARFVAATDMRRLAEHYAEQPTRRRLKEKNPAEYRKFVDGLASLSAHGIANTMRGVQSRRPPLYVHKDRVAAMATPALVVLGAEDEPCVRPSHFLAETLPGARLEVIAGTGHLVNLEAPDIVNRLVADFIDAVERRRAAR